MSTWDPYDEPEFEGIYELPVRDRPVMSPPPRLLPTRKLIDQVRVACDLDEATAERVAHWAADWGVQPNLAPLRAPPPIRRRSEREDRSMSRRNDAKEDR